VYRLRPAVLYHVNYCEDKGMLKKMKNTGRIAAVATTLVAALALSACASGDPLADGSGSNDTSAITIGSQAYYSNEIIAEIYAQALENEGIEVERKFNIGQRDAYLPALEQDRTMGGAVDLFPEYTGNLLQYYDPETTVTSTDAVYDALKKALPEGLEVLNQAPATDQDSYNVTAEFAEANKLVTIGDLKKVTTPLILGGYPELAERPYGPIGLEEKYGVTVSFIATGDTTVDDLLAGTITMANVYSADPRIQTDNLVTLEDPDGLFLASHVVPLIRSEIKPEVEKIINAVSAKLTAAGLVSLNVQSTVDGLSPEVIARGWLEENGFIK
jgi:osmoprotectant transport system substrate-binding protein